MRVWLRRTVPEARRVHSTSIAASELANVAEFAVDGDGHRNRHAEPELCGNLHALLVLRAMTTYGEGVRAHFLCRLSRPQIAAMGENCRRISVALKTAAPPAKLGRV